ncbi:glycine cleavage system aminomethyltransferase GcvT, partial [Bacillus cereus]|nr:glycine cleavage system aminomethyltransferase GcvT [Bacillus cereus]
LIYQKGENRYLLVINASNIDKDLEWMKEHVTGNVQIDNQSDQIALLAVQGPKTETILKTLTSADLSALKPFTFIDEADISGCKALISRTGYTGEDG